MKFIATTLPLFILYCFFVSPANADLINIISETHSVYGSIASGDYYSYTSDKSASISGEVYKDSLYAASGAGNLILLRHMLVI
jgi:hypothetical protein